MAAAPYQSRLFRVVSQTSLQIRDRLGIIVRHAKVTMVWGIQAFLYPLYLLTQERFAAGHPMGQAVQTVLSWLPGARSPQPSSSTRSFIPPNPAADLAHPAIDPSHPRPSASSVPLQLDTALPQASIQREFSKERRSLWQTLVDRWQALVTPVRPPTHQSPDQSLQLPPAKHRLALPGAPVELPTWIQPIAQTVSHLLPQPLPSLKRLLPPLPTPRLTDRVLQGLRALDRRVAQWETRVLSLAAQPALSPGLQPPSQSGLFDDPWNTPPSVDSVDLTIGTTHYPTQLKSLPPAWLPSWLQPWVKPVHHLIHLWSSHLPTTSDLDSNAELDDPWSMDTVPAQAIVPLRPNPTALALPPSLLTNLRQWLLAQTQQWQRQLWQWLQGWVPPQGLLHRPTTITTTHDPHPWAALEDETIDPWLRLLNRIDLGIANPSDTVTIAAEGLLDVTDQHTSKLAIKAEIAESEVENFNEATDLGNVAVGYLDADPAGTLVWDMGNSSCPEFSPNWIDTQATTVEYVKHPLEWVLGWLDRAMLWIETGVMKLWEWLRGLFTTAADQSDGAD